MVESRSRKILAGLTLFFCFGFNAFHVIAQDLLSAYLCVSLRSFASLR